MRPAFAVKIKEIDAIGLDLQPCTFQENMFFPANLQRAIGLAVETSHQICSSGGYPRILRAATPLALCRLTELKLCCFSTHAPKPIYFQVTQDGFRRDKLRGFPGGWQGSGSMMSSCQLQCVFPHLAICCFIQGVCSSPGFTCCVVGIYIYIIVIRLYIYICMVPPHPQKAVKPGSVRNGYLLLHLVSPHIGSEPQWPHAIQVPGLSFQTASRLASTWKTCRRIWKLRGSTSCEKVEGRRDSEKDTKMICPTPKKWSYVVLPSRKPLVSRTFEGIRDVT